MQIPPLFFGNVKRCADAERVSQRRDRLQASRQQSGTLLIEMAIALLLASLLAVWTGHRMMQQVEDTQAHATGEWFLTIKNSVDQLLSTNYPAYADASFQIEGVDVWNPTVADLKKIGLLAAHFPERSPMGVQARIRIERTESNCPGNTCRVEALVYSDQPIKRPQSPDADLDLVAAVVAAMGGVGGAAWQDDPQQVKGSQFQLANPLGAKVGIVGATAMFDSTLYQQFVRIQDTRNPDLQGNLSVRGGAEVQRIALQEVVQPNTPCTLIDMQLEQNASTSQAQIAATSQGGLAVCVKGKWQALSTMVNAFEPCALTGSPEGAIGQNGDGVGMLCRNGVWTPIAQHISRFVLMGSQMIPQAIQTNASAWDISKPSCGLQSTTGTARIIAIPQVLQPRGDIQLKGDINDSTVNLAVDLTLDAWQFHITDTGAMWRVHIPGQSQMLANIYCVY